MKVRIQTFQNDIDQIVNSFLARIPAGNVIDIKVNVCPEHGTTHTIIYKTEVQDG